MVGGSAHLPEACRTGSPGPASPLRKTGKNHGLRTGEDPPQAPGAAVPSAGGEGTPRPQPRPQPRTRTCSRLLRATSGINARRASCAHRHAKPVCHSPSGNAQPLSSARAETTGERVPTCPAALELRRGAAAGPLAAGAKERGRPRGSSTAVVAPFPRRFLGRLLGAPWSIPRRC